mgnify:CR=1 FL=1
MLNIVDNNSKVRVDSPTKSKVSFFFACEDIILVPVDPTVNEQAQPFYQPPPPPMGYPVPPSTNPYATQSGSFAPNQPPYPVHAQTMNPYLVKEGKRKKDEQFE